MLHDESYLFDILDSAQLAISYVAQLSWPEFQVNVELQDAVIRRIIIIGEAANQLTPQFCVDHPELPTSEMIGMRNVLVHDYDGVDIARVWQTLKTDLPQVIESIKRLSR
jgi:uncharacterized protein with HEPN domain